MDLGYFLLQHDSVVSVLDQTLVKEGFEEEIAAQFWSLLHSRLALEIQTDAILSICSYTEALEYSHLFLSSLLNNRQVVGSTTLVARLLWILRQAKVARFPRSNPDFQVFWRCYARFVQTFFGVSDDFWNLGSTALTYQIPWGDLKENWSPSKDVSFLESLKYWRPELKVISGNKSISQLVAVDLAKVLVEESILYFLELGYLEDSLALV